MTIDELRNRFQVILDRESGNIDDDVEDAIQALLEYVDDPEIQEMYDRIR